MRGGLLDSRQGWGAAERLHEGFWRRVKTQESLPSEGAEPFGLGSMGRRGRTKLERLKAHQREAS